MLTVVALGCLGVAAGIAVRWMLHRTDAIGRRRPFPFVSVALCLVVAIGCAVPVLRHRRLESRLSSAATAIVGFPVHIHCQTAGETMLDASGDLGHVAFDADGIPEHRAVVKWEQCRDVAAWLGSGSGGATPEQLVAVHVLTHESMHMAGEADEAKTECAAVQRDRAMARALGASERDAVVLARRYWMVVYPSMPDGYRSNRCGPGLAFDERKKDAPWAQ